MLVPPDIGAKVRLFLMLVQEAAEEQLAKDGRARRDGMPNTREERREAAPRRADYWVPAPHQALVFYKMREANRMRTGGQSGPK